MSPPLPPSAHPLDHAGSPAAEPVRVLFVDDNLLAAEAFERFMAGRPEIHLVAACPDVSLALTRAADSQPHVVLLDLDMPGQDTLGAIGLLQRAAPRATVVIFSGHCTADGIGRALDAGAMGYICKDEPTGVIVELLVRAAAGEAVFSPTAARALLGSP